MSINLQLPKLTELKPRITVIGVGGAGGNAVNNMISSGLTGVEFVVANTDAQALMTSSAEQVVQLGVNLTEGLGAGARPEIGEAAAEEAIEDLRGFVSGSHMVFIACGMGGGTGTGAASVIARAAREMGILTVGIVTKPFQFEGSRRMRIAEAGIGELKAYVDTLIVIPNQNLFRIASEKTTFAEAFILADQVLYSGIACIVDLILKEGLINLDFADVRAIMSGMGSAMMGTGEGEGERRAIVAAEEAISNPLLDGLTLQGARGLLLSIVGGHDLTLYEVDEAASRVRQEVDADANIIVGASFDDNLGDRVRVSIVASGMTGPGDGTGAAGDGTGAAGDGTGAAKVQKRPDEPTREAPVSPPPLPSEVEAQRNLAASADVGQSETVLDQPAAGAAMEPVGGDEYRMEPAGGDEYQTEPAGGEYQRLLAQDEQPQGTMADAVRSTSAQPSQPQSSSAMSSGTDFNSSRMAPSEAGSSLGGAGQQDRVSSPQHQPGASNLPGNDGQTSQIWQAPGDVTIEQTPPQLNAAASPVQAAAPQSPLGSGALGAGTLGAGAGAAAGSPATASTAKAMAPSPAFAPAPPQDPGKRPRRMPSVEDFPSVGQRDYHAKTNAAARQPVQQVARNPNVQGKPNAQGKVVTPPRKAGFFERLTGRRSQAGDATAPNHPPSSYGDGYPQNARSGQAGQANASVQQRSQGGGKAPGDSKITDESVDLPMFFNNGRR